MPIILILDTNLYSHCDRTVIVTLIMMSATLKHRTTLILFYLLFLFSAICYIVRSCKRDLQKSPLLYNETQLPARISFFFYTIILKEIYLFICLNKIKPKGNLINNYRCSQTTSSPSFTWSVQCVGKPFFSCMTDQAKDGLYLQSRCIRHFSKRITGQMLRVLFVKKCTQLLVC